MLLILPVQRGLGVGFTMTLKPGRKGISSTGSNYNSKLERERNCEPAITWNYQWNPLHFLHPKNTQWTWEDGSWNSQQHAGNKTEKYNGIECNTIQYRRNCLQQIDEKRIKEKPKDRKITTTTHVVALRCCLAFHLSILKNSCDAVSCHARTAAMKVFGHGPLQTQNYCRHCELKKNMVPLGRRLRLIQL